MFSKFLGNYMFSKNWNLYCFYNVVQTTVHAIASYDGVASILGSARFLELLRSKAK